MKKPCAHVWGPTLYAPVFTGRTFCFSPPEHHNRWIRYCKKCSRVEEMFTDANFGWCEAKGLLTPCEQLLFTMQRDAEIEDGKKERSK